MLRKFKIGQFVKYIFNSDEGPTSRGIYRITGFLPEASDEPEYLIRNSIEGYERLVKESELVQLQGLGPNVGKPTKRGRSCKPKPVT
jgi:hypothetical protein